MPAFGEWTSSAPYWFPPDGNSPTGHNRAGTSRWEDVVDDGSDPVFPLAALPAGAVVVRDRIIVAGNAAGLGALGGGPEVVGSALTDLIDDPDRAGVEAALAGTEAASTSVPARRGGGPERGRQLELAVGPPDPDGFRLVLVRERVEESRLEAVIDALGDSTMVLDADGLVEWQSARLQARVDTREPEAGLGVNPLERLHPEDLPAVLDAWADAVEHEGRVIRYITRSRSVEDDDVWQRIEITGASQLQHPDVQGMVIQIRNLDDGEIVASLAETDGQYLSLADAAPIGIVVTDPYGRTIYRNGTARRLLEQPELRSDTEWREFAEPSFRPDLETMVERATIAGEASMATAAFVVPSGERRWFRVHVTPRFADGRHALGLITTLEDVTAEVEARAETERLTHMLDATSDYVAVFRPDGEILYVNRSTRRLLDALTPAGGTAELKDLIDDEARRVWIASAMEVLLTSDVWEGELPLNAGEGRTIPVSATGVISRLPSGDLDWIALHARDITDLKEAEDRQRLLATHDSLTGLANRSLGNDRLERAVARHRRDGKGVAVMFCDLDGFKAINDSHGHAAGDRVLATIAQRLLGITRETDTAARVGGDEFVIVCEGVTDTDELATMAERVIEAVSRPIPIDEAGDGESVRVGISIGVGVVRSRLLDPDADMLLTLADTAMYRAKARGGNTFRLAHLEPE